jgi:hypothetical protein
MLKIKIISRGLFLNIIIFIIGALMIDRKLDNLYPILPLLLFTNFCYQWYIFSSNPKSTDKSNWTVATINFVLTIVLSIASLAIWIILLTVSGIPKNRAVTNHNVLYKKEFSKDFKKKLFNGDLYF